MKGGVLLPTQSFGSHPAAVSQQGVLREAGGGQPPEFLSALGWVEAHGAWGGGPTPQPAGAPE